MSVRSRKKRRLSTSQTVESEEPISSNVGLTSQKPEQSKTPSVLSLKSDRSMYRPIVFGPEGKQSQQSGESTASSTVSMEKAASMGEPIVFGHRKTQSQPTGEPSSCSACTGVLRDPVRRLCGHWSCKQCHILDCECLSELGREFKRRRVASPLMRARQFFKEEMKGKFASISEGNGDPKSSLNSKYTTLLISIKENEGLHEEHVFRHIKQKFKPGSPTKKVDLCDSFKPLPGHQNKIRMVLTKGVAGIGKSFSVQKFILDWAEGKENQDFSYVFCIAFRELNLISDDKSLLQLLTKFHPAFGEQENSENYVKTRVIVILDGLDESRLQLDFEGKPVKSVTEVTSVASLLANLIKGNLLPDAKLWITSRPAAAYQIPAEYVDMVTEIRGFSDSQKEEYFRRRFRDDSSLADRIVSHIRSSQSLDIMCQIPIFCWISAVLFEEIFGEDKAEIPQTLTEMMAHYLLAQTIRSSRKYSKSSEEQLLKKHKEFLLKLGKLAFIQLQKNNIIFYDEDLEDCGIDVKEATIYSGFCSGVLREEQAFSQKVFFFVHLTIQEFFAALFVYDCFSNQKTEELSNFLDLKDESYSLLELLKLTVEKVLEDKNSHLDFFMQFLLGLMVESNRRVLQGLLTSPDQGQDTDKKILTHLKAIRRKTLSPDRSIILFQTMVEMKDHKVKDEIQEFLRLPERSKTELTSLQCSALAYMLQVSENDLEVLDLKSFNTTDEGRRRLIPAVRVSRKAILADCKVTEDWVEHLASGLKFPYLPLRDLDLSNNDLKDSGVKLLCDGLSSQSCRLKTLRLSGCLVTEEGCASLVSALKSNPSHLIELDLSYNNPGESGKKLLSELKGDAQYKLDILSTDHDGDHRMKPGFKKYACMLTFDQDTAQKILTFTDENRKVSWVEEEQQFPKDGERFGTCQRLLCQQGLNERSYFEIEMLETFAVGLTYKTTDKKGDAHCKLGQDDRSWCLNCSDDGCYALYDNQRFNVAARRSRSSRVAVYLDWVAGTLSFYKVSSDSRTRLHTFKTTFSQPLHLAVELYAGSSASLCLPV
ncbi:NLR family CARD domain-containing protein 3-like [Xyrichtys novacula]|uniref:NLR family CARD domain-containing protein 3-like n=1 Tax=Xyrichtys novacula TaxID=13765 RepID=A0AAV1HI74_XYRNO|nr:NLR family CARD domain-containing protein 3-like [Xyrichtys novacula]